jgi:hypothetical protein
MAGVSGWYSTAYNCEADPSKSHGIGWYINGQLVSSTYKNPSTGLPYTSTELNALAGGGTTSVGIAPTTSQLEAGTTGNLPTYSSTEPPPVGSPAGNYWLNPETGLWESTSEALLKPRSQTVAPNIAPTTSQLEANAVANIPTLPAYKPTAELEQLSTQVGGAISDIITQKGLGMGEETKEALYLKSAETINAGTAQAMKNLEDKMAAQGLSNSGMSFSEGMKLQSKGTIAMANEMRDIEIQDSLMKVASYQNALGLGVQFLSYLSEESWRQYQPTLYQWQAQVDMYKLAINQAYTQQNMTLAYQYDKELAQFEASTQIQLTQMTIDAAAKAADKKTFWDIIGVGLGIIGKIILAGA